MEQTDFAIFEREEPHLTQASRGKRFINYIIDSIVICIVAFILLIVLSIIASDMMERLFDDESARASLLLRAVGSLLFGLLWGIMEIIFKGKTVGKYVTGTRAVNEDGSPISVKKALLRGLCRILPFEPLTALGNPSYPWHDSATKTYVIDEQLSFYLGQPAGSDIL